jgi:hypothetical protein
MDMPLSKLPTEPRRCGFSFPTGREKQKIDYFSELLDTQKYRLCKMNAFSDESSSFP